jgi:hypothetical protein
MAQFATDSGIAPDRDATANVREAAEILREIIVVGLSAALVGLVVGGVGGRIVMRVAALLNAQAVGISTENGNRIGDITVGGTFALLVIAGIFASLFATGFWVTVRPWLPAQRPRRAAAAAVLAVALSGFGLVDSHNPDFFVLGSDLLIAAMLLAIPALFGLGLVVVEPWVDRRIPHPGLEPWRFVAAATWLVGIGAVFALPGTVGLMFSEDACLCSVAPIPIGVPLAVAGVATVITWLRRVRLESGPSRLIAGAGRLGVVGAGLLGSAILVTEIANLPM